MSTSASPVLQVPVVVPAVRNVLVPIDFSDASRCAFERALDVARLFHSTVFVAHVITPATLTFGPTDLELRLQSELDVFEIEAAAQGIRCETLMLRGAIVDTIDEIVAEYNIDLLVIATHGGRGVHGVFLGSTAEHLIRHTTIPVITVGSAADQPTWSQDGLRNILFAGNFAPEIFRPDGLSVALGLSQLTGARLSVVETVPAGTWPEIVQALHEDIAAVVPPGTGINIVPGPVGRGVCRVARNIGADLVALSVHPSSFTREIFGSGLLELLLNAPCPVVTMRHQKT
jgi:nucleotide-binding universal stress UspA family protein